MTSGFSRVRLFFGIAFAALIFAAVYSQFSPIEKARERDDLEATRYGEELLKGINEFYKEYGRLPWTDDLGSELGFTPLTFTNVLSPAIGLCQDANCSSPGELAIFKASLFPPTPLKSEAYIGKIAESNSPIYFCFVPSSQAMRLAVGNLKEIKTKSGEFFANPRSCSGRVNWQEDVCFVCLQ